MLKVTYKVEATRVEQRTDFDRLVVDVETKPSIAPARRHRRRRQDPGRAVRPGPRAERRRRGHRDRARRPADAADSPNFSLPIEDLDLTVRSYNCLKREGIHTVGELVARREADLLDIRNFGAKSIDEVKVKLAAMGLALKDSPPGFDPHVDRELRRGLRDRRVPGLAEYADVEYSDASYQETEQL